MRRDIMERFYNLIEVTESGCWQWLGAKHWTGYAYFTIGYDVDKSTTLYLIHRLTYTLFVGDIPDGLVIDHLCRNRACANPDHLEAVTQMVNNMRSNCISNKFRAKTECPQGHLYDSINYRGNRTCTICMRAAVRRCDAKRRLKRDLERQQVLV